jgi:AraC-like DNA-binding protein
MTEELDHETSQSMNHSAKCSIELPVEFSSLPFHLEYLGHGISLYWVDGNIRTDIVSPFTIDEPSLAFSTFLSGYTEYSLSHISAKRKSAICLQPCDVVFSNYDCDGIAHMYAKAPYRSVSIMLKPSFIEEMFATSGMPVEFPNSLKKIQKGLYPHKISSLSKQTQTIAFQILACPMTEICRTLFLEGKALELLSFYLNKLLLGNDKYPQLTKSDVERIYAAREIILSNINNPPTIHKLSSLCGLNEFKMKNGFRIYFGNTIHGIVKKERMKIALDLLRDSDTSVGIVANTVGYSSVGHFIIAFRNEFGVTPGQVLKNARRTHDRGIIKK